MLGLLLAAAAAPAADVPPAPMFPGVPPPVPSRVMHYQKPAGPVPALGDRSDPTVRPAALQAPAAPSAAEELRDKYQIRLEPPGPDVLYRLDSEIDLERRMQQEAKQSGQPEPGPFPPKPVLSTVRFAGRSFPKRPSFVEPYYVCYTRLYYEEKNSERYGWDLGFIQPFVSAAWFYKDVLLAPAKLATYPCRRAECNTSYCLPGNPVPYILYPPEITWTGLMGEAGIILLGAAIIP